MSRKRGSRFSDKDDVQLDKFAAVAPQSGWYRSAGARRPSRHCVVGHRRGM